VEQIKSDVASVLKPELIIRLCRETGHVWRDRILNPVTTVHAFLLQVLHGNTACDHLPHLLGMRFTGEADCQARSRIPLELFSRLLRAVSAAVPETLDEGERWLGHRVWVRDGSTCSMPDEPPLQEAFGQPGGQRPGCGFPVVHLLALFHAGTGLLLQVGTAPWRTHDLALASRTHGAMRPGDVLLADRGFCSFAHLALLFQAGIHAVFRAHQKTIVSFRKGRLHRPPKPCRGRLKLASGLPTSRWVKWLGHVDQVVEYFKPRQRPAWMTAEDDKALPASLFVRELRYRIAEPGYRTREVILVTTLVDAATYSSAELADLSATRWEVETNLKHLKQTLRMDVLHTKSVNNIYKELAMYALVYNLVRLVMLEASARQGTPVDRISFIDALRWLRHAQPGILLGPLIVIPLRRGRCEPRVRKRRCKNFPVMMRPRDALREALIDERR
jgi:hypothetical protein